MSVAIGIDYANHMCVRLYCGTCVHPVRALGLDKLFLSSYIYYSILIISKMLRIYAFQATHYSFFLPMDIIPQL